MSNETTLKEKGKRIGNVLAIAKDGERSMVERVVACDMAFELMYRSKTAEDMIEISYAFGIDKEKLGAWGLARTFQSIDETGTFDGTSIAEKSKAIAAVLFPDLVGGEVDE